VSDSREGLAVAERRHGGGGNLARHLLCSYGPFSKPMCVGVMGFSPILRARKGSIQMRHLIEPIHFCTFSLMLYKIPHPVASPIGEQRRGQSNQAMWRVAERSHSTDGPRR
jgi:hypothetical protein